MPNVNHIVTITGRGANHCFMMNGETQDVANRCQVAVDCGFEVFIYLIEPSPSGQPSYSPTGGLCLRRVYHLYEQAEKYLDEARSLIDRLSSSSCEASKKYLHLMIDEFNKELVNLDDMMKQPNCGDPPTTTTTGS